MCIYIYVCRNTPDDCPMAGQTVHWSLGEMVAMWRRAAPRHSPECRQRQADAKTWWLGFQVQDASLVLLPCFQSRQSAKRSQNRLKPQARRH